MRKKNYKGRCEKQMLAKFTTICKSYEPLQSTYAKVLSENPNITEISYNVPLDSTECQEYTTDFLCIKTDGDFMIRECIRSKLLSRPQMAAMLDLSRNYWLRRGVTDWGIVIDAPEE